MIEPERGKKPRRPYGKRLARLQAADDARLSAPMLRIVLAYLRHNRVPPAEVAALVSSVRLTLRARLEWSRDPKNRPMAQHVRDSIQDDYLVSFEDGKKYQMLRRHLSERGITPDEYRAKWGLPDHYPMVAPVFARHRSGLAKEGKLGHWSRTDKAMREAGYPITPKAPTPDVADAGARKCGRPRKATA